MFPCWVAALLLNLAAGPLLASDDAGGALRITHAWSRPTPPTIAVGAVYLSITNRGAVGDRLLALNTPIAAAVEIHETRTVDGVMEMRPVEGLDCPPNTTVKIEPGGVHIMLIGLRAPLAQGADFPLELRFARAGKLTIRVHVGETR